MNKKTIFITGASSGIGRACATEFAKVGARVLVCARRVEKIDELVSSLQEKYDVDVHGFGLDVTNRQEVHKALNSLPEEWSKIDTLINNAGGAHGTEKLFEGDVNDWDAMIDVNIKGLLYVSREVLPGMVERNSGHVINIGSVAGHDPYEGGSVYCGTKFFVRGMSRALKMDLLGTPIRVTSIDPGAVETEFSNVRLKGDQEKVEQVYEGMTPLTAQEIAETIVFAATRPAHVNISEMLVLPTDQSGTGPGKFYRRS